MTLEVTRCSKRFGGVKAVHDCSFRIEPGKITALIGPNGSGKSTMFNLVANLVKKDKGKVFFAGQEVTKLPDFKIARKGVSRTFQQVRLFRNLTIRDHLEIALSKDDEKLFSSLWKSTDHLKKIQRVLELVHLDKPLDTLATDLSYGQRKLLDLAMAIAKPHTLLMLDEPVAGVNPKLREEIKKIIRSLNEKGDTILIIEHDMNFVMDLADQVIVLDAGSLLVAGKPDEVKNNPKVLEAYLGC